MPTHLSLTEALDEAQALDELIRRGMYGHDLDGGARSILSHAALDVTMGHFIAMRSLSERTDTDSTLRALLRPLIESGYRALYLRVIASDKKLEEMQKAENWRGWPSVPSIAECVDSHIEDHDDLFSAFVADFWLAHDFTHCGMETIKRHIHPEGGIGPQNNPRDRATVIHRATIILAAICAIMARHDERFDLEEQLWRRMGSRVTS